MSRRDLSLDPKTGRPICPKCGNVMWVGARTPAGRIRWYCRPREGGGEKTYCYSTTRPETGPRRKQSGSKANARPPRFTRKLATNRFVVTAAQNATGVHKGFLTALIGYCEHNNAELIVVPIRYKNPTSVWTASQANEETWALELAPYLYNQRKKLGQSMITLLGDVKTRPTAVSPLDGFEGITHGESCILAHTRVQLKTIPTPQNSLPKILTTTGAVTLKNYTDSKAGKLGEFHHTYGAAVVETRGKTFHLRQISAAQDGTFTDLAREYLPNGRSRKAPRAAALVLGDLHFRVMDPKVIKATFGPGGIVETLDPECLVFHDLLDGMSRNPWHRNDPFAESAKRSKDFHLVEREVRETIEWVDKIRGKRRAIVVPSNHDAFLTRWIFSADWKSDTDNAEFYLETALAMLRGTKMTPQGHETPDPFIYWARKLAREGLEAPEMDTSIVLRGVEVGAHGHRGPNGAKGSVQNLSRLGVRVSSGHGHSPAIEGGHHRVGTSSYLRLEYNQGPSSWLNTHGVIYGNAGGKRTLINIIDGEWKI